MVRWADGPMGARSTMICAEKGVSDSGGFSTGWFPLIPQKESTEPDGFSTTGFGYKVYKVVLKT